MKNKILSRNFNNSMVASGLSEEHITKNWLAEDGDVNSEKKKKVDKINKQKLDFENQFEQIKSEVIKKNNWS